MIDDSDFTSQANIQTFSSCTWVNRSKAHPPIIYRTATPRKHTHTRTNTRTERHQPAGVSIGVVLVPWALPATSILLHPSHLTTLLALMTYTRQVVSSSRGNARRCGSFLKDGFYGCGAGGAATWQVKQPRARGSLPGITEMPELRDRCLVKHNQSLMELISKQTHFFIEWGRNSGGYWHPGCDDLSLHRNVGPGVVEIVKEQSLV